MIATIMMMVILLVTTAFSQPTFPGIGNGNGVTPTMQWYNTPPFCSQYSSCPTATPYEISRAKCTAGQSGNKCCLSGQQILCTNINPSSSTPNAPSLPFPSLPGATGAAGLPSLANVASPVVPTFVNGLNNALSTPGAGVTGIIAAIGQGITNIANGGNGNGVTGISLPSLPLGGIGITGAATGLPSWPFDLPNTGITGGNFPLPSLPIGTGAMGIPSLPSITGITGAGMPSLPISLPTTGMTGGSGIGAPDVPILSLPTTGAMGGLPSITGMPDILPNGGPIGVTGGTLPSLPISLPTDMPSLPFTPSSLSLSRQILATPSPSPSPVASPSPIGAPISSPPNDPTIVPSSPSSPSPSSPPLSPMPILPELPIDPAVDYFPLPSPSPSPSNPSSTSPGVPSAVSSVSSSRRKLLTIGGVGVPLVGASIIPGPGPIGGGVITGAPIQQGPGSVAAAAAATWFGAGPVCANAVCPDGWRFLASARCANGDCCLVGQKVYCQPITGPGKAGGPGLGINTIGAINSPVIAIGGGGGPLHH